MGMDSYDLKTIREIGKSIIDKINDSKGAQMEANRKLDGIRLSIESLNKESDNLRTSSFEQKLDELIRVNAAIQNQLFLSNMIAIAISENSDIDLQYRQLASELVNQTMSDIMNSSESKLHVPILKPIEK